MLKVDEYIKKISSPHTQGNLKIGDTVKIISRENLNLLENIRPSVTMDMLKHCNKSYTINHIGRYGTKKIFQLENCGRETPMGWTYWSWSIECFR